MKNLIDNFKLLMLILLANKIYSEIIPIHIGSPNHRHFIRTTPIKNEENLRASGLIPVSRNQMNSNHQMSLIPDSPNEFSLNQFNLMPDTPSNQNFEYSKRIGIPAKRSTYKSPQTSFYESEKQKIFKRDEMSNYKPNNYQSNYQAPVNHQPRNYGYIPSNANSYDYDRTNQYNTPYSQQQYANQAQYGQQQPPHNHARDNQEYQQNNNNDPLDMNDVGLDGGLDNSFYDMPFNQELDNNGQLFNDAMNFDMRNFY